ncbi:MAG: DNA ligase [Gammaproteobacteria bacterium]|nr:DNA ligase [Gammaproteobacteria bacterium]
MKYFLAILLVFSSISPASPPGLQLADIYHHKLDLQNYWVSEKYDGVRAFWNGKQLISRQGNVINAPGWFTRVLPEEQLDGELWLARGQFDRLSGIVRRQSADGPDWVDVKYMVFDLPNSPLVFDQRLQNLEAIIQQINRPFVRLVKQEKIATHDLLMQRLDKVVAAGGEGLMLHLGTSTYKNYRSDDLLKLKKHFDAEAVVIKHIPGKGKYKGLMGSILVETGDGKQFKIGSGFSDAERHNPPAIGATITYKYFGFTSNGIPRFASFLRVRNAH